MTEPMRRWSRIRDGVLVAAAIGAFLIALWLIWGSSSPRPRTVRLTAGSVDGQRHRIAQLLADTAMPRGLTIELVPTSGSVDALSQVADGTLDFAMVQGGLDRGARDEVLQVAALHLEPLHLLVRDGLQPMDREPFRLTALRGCRVNLSKPGSGTSTLAEALLRFADLEPTSRSVDLEIDSATSTYRASHMSYSEILDAGRDVELPDAFFMVSSLPSPVAGHLIDHRGYHIVGIPLAEAFGIDDLDSSGPIRDRDPDAPRSARILRRRIEPTIIPASTYNVDPPEPPEAIPTLGTRLLVVAREEVNAEAIASMLDAIFQSDFARITRPSLREEDLRRPPERPLHPGTVRYLKRNQPLITGDVIEFCEQGLAILGALLSGLFFIWQAYRRIVQRRRDRGFEQYLRRVGQIEQRSLALETAPELDLAALLRLRRELDALKQQVIGQFVDGQLEGSDVMSNFLTHASDIRSHLTRLILHERDNLEQQAAEQDRTVRDLWDSHIDLEP